MDNIPDYLRIGIPTIRRQKTVDEIQCEMRDKISVLEKDNRELIEIKVKRETELFQLRERLENLEKLYNEIREEKHRPSPVINEEDKKKPPSQYGDLHATKIKLDRISNTLQKIKNRQATLKQPVKIEV
jgi:predicted nuclease with TOPRIM domain